MMGGADGVWSAVSGDDGVWSAVSDEWTLPAGKMVADETAEKKELILMLIELRRESDSEGGNERIRCVSYN